MKKIAQADVEFHEVIYEAAGNAKLVTMLNNLRDHMYRYRVEYLKDDSKYPELIREHQAIMEGIRTKDKKHVSEVMKKHVLNQAVAIKNMIREQDTDV